MKKCDLGDHEVSALWRSRTKTQCSGCKECVNRENAAKALSKATEQVVNGINEINERYNQRKQPLQEVNGKRYKKVEIKAKRSRISNDSDLEGKSTSELLKLAQIVFNRWIRKRDSQDGYFTCISSGQILPVSQMNAGHFFPVSTSSMLRFDEDNVHGQSIGENYFNPDHQKSYRDNLIKKIGRFNLERLESLQHCEKKWSKDELLNIIEKYK